MRVQVIHLLSAAGARVEHRAKPGIAARVGDAELAGQTRDQYKHSTKQRRVFFRAVGQRGDVPAGNHEHMRLGRRTDIAERDELVVLVTFGGRTVASGDPAEKALTWVVTHGLPETRTRDPAERSEPRARIQQRLVVIQIQPALDDT